MDELQLVRDFYGEPTPPSREVTAAARARLRLSGGAARAVRLGGSRRSLVRAGIPAAVLAVAAAVAVAVVVQAPARAPAPANVPAIGVFRLPAGALGQAPAGATANGREILLNAAQTVARAAEPATGRYWVMPSIVGNVLPAGTAANPYFLLDEVATQVWARQSPHDFVSDLWQPLRVQLAAPGDEAAWRRDGSPTTWENASEATSLASPLGYTNGASPSLPVTSGRGQLDSEGGGDIPPLSVGAKDLTYQQLRQLPADPARLKPIFTADIPPDREGQSVTSYLLQLIPPVLEMPVTPAVRAALYRLLASLPGIQNLGTVTDVTGQRGVAVGYTGRYSGCGSETPLTGNGGIQHAFASCAVQQILVINPSTGLPLAAELRYVALPAGANWPVQGGLFSYQIFQSAYWTNASPPQPPARPAPSVRAVPKPTGPSCFSFPGKNGKEQTQCVVLPAAGKTSRP